ncbi:MAG TPA: bifunctional histidinol-phosphatase/imidazoleglycerol-phosphate dehydratase HisB [Gammaproteobacteria bacterium]|nr:bifunctional histidinol-phosphatase/imidazoleglycerol-phosphate dehydratase HisB [Gammaproteobacteria bacterium]
MPQEKLLFIDRDGTLIEEPEDQQIDSIEKLHFLPDVISSLLKLKTAGYKFIMVSNQDGLGTDSLPHGDFQPPHELMLRILSSQGIHFDAIHICPHKPDANCDCRKPKIGLLANYLIEQKINREHSYVIGDRQTDLELAQNLGIKGIRIRTPTTPGWAEVAHQILSQPRQVQLIRKTKETAIEVQIDLDKPSPIHIHTGIGFFDHMLEQLAKHGGFSLKITVAGDLHIDDHHTVEDTAITLGEAMREALGDKIGIGRYGFLLPMDEALARVAIDLSGRAHLTFKAAFNRERVGDLSTELVEHFFRSFAEGLKATLNIKVTGDNTHHMIESVFKGVGRALRQAIAKTGDDLPSTKGLL